MNDALSASPTLPPPVPRVADLVLARVHLRLGALALARAELETLAGRDGLDHDGLIDLAEVRWRTGDVVGAGEAAAAALENGEPHLVALVVAAEAAMDRGRPTEARRHAEQALALGRGSVDVIFGGMPRAGVWPVDPLTPPPVATTLFDDPRGLTVPPGAASPPVPDPLEPTDGRGAAGGLDDDRIDPASIGLWDGTEDGAPVIPVLPSPDDALEVARLALREGRRSEAAIAFGLVLRMAPALAPVVVAALAHERSADLALTRGDAYRLVGREAEALRAFAEALPALPHPLSIDASDGSARGNDPTPGS